MSVLNAELEQAMCDRSQARGLGHDFYPYPARLSPAIARTLIQHYSVPGDWVLDPFMGAGTTVIEALAAGRRAIGVDINAIAYELACARTTPVSPADAAELKAWAGRALDHEVELPEGAAWLGLPCGSFFAALSESAGALSLPRRRRFARAILLRLGQWALDRRDEPPALSQLLTKLADGVDHLSQGVGQLVQSAREYGVQKSRISRRRRLLLRNAIALDAERRLSDLHGCVDLVVSSPPYPGVHVLYHRWQLRSRRETPAPYWLIGAQDGHGPAFYTMGGRSQTGQRNYFLLVERSFRGIKPLLKSSARVCLVLAFRDPDSQLPLFLDAVHAAGFRLADQDLVWREVPNRKWYAKRQRDQNAAREVLLVLSPQ